MWHVWGDRRSVYRVVVLRHDRKNPLRRLRHRWEVNIKVYLIEVGLGDMDLIHLGEDRDWWRALANAVMNRP